MNVFKQQIARLRQELDTLEAAVDAAENAAEAENVDLDAWVERNADALNASIKRGDEDMARGNYVEGTADQILDYILDKARQRAMNA